MTTTIFRINPVIRTIPPICGAAIASCMVLLCISPILRPESFVIKIATVMTPRPPTWIRHKITVCPKTDQYVAVSLVISPVTQVAEVAVNSASRNGALPAPARAHGSISRIVPDAITPRNPKRMICDDERRLLFNVIFMINLPVSQLNFLSNAHIPIRIVTNNIALFHP